MLVVELPVVVDVVVGGHGVVVHHLITRGGLLVLAARIIIATCLIRVREAVSSENPGEVLFGCGTIRRMLRH